MEPMTVIIKEREVLYESDYPDGWEFSAGDPFKFPVSVGGYPCFIKRFGENAPKQVSGWQLLMKLRGKYERNVSRVYDIKQSRDGDETYYYIFYEYLNGATLDKMVSDPVIDLKHLANDLIDGIAVLQRNEFWFADFTEKNIFCDKNGVFSLIDIDSAHPLSSPPDNDMFGSKDYWILVFSFYKNVLKKGTIRVNDISGINLNFLQIPFLILRLKLFQSGNVKDYNSPEIFNSLPATLSQIAPELAPIFLEVITNATEPLSVVQISRIRDIIDRKIIRQTRINEVLASPAVLPQIKSFSASANQIESGSTFTLQWQTENADRVEVYKNGARFRALDIARTSLSLSDFADGTRSQSSYYLVAYKELAMAKSDPVVINRVEKPKLPPRRSRFVFIAGAIVCIAVVAYFLLRPVAPGNYHLRADDVLYENADFSIHGENLPDSNSVHVYFDDLAMSIKRYSADSLLVRFPAFQDPVPDGRNLIVKSDTQTIFSHFYTFVLSNLGLFDSASKAHWIRGVLLPDGNDLNPSVKSIQSTWPGAIGDNEGYARTENATMEDEKQYPVLRTHPWWLSNGTIKGEFPWSFLQGKKTFRATVGFVQDMSPAGAASTDGVDFQVWIHYKINAEEKSRRIYSQHKDYNARLLKISADFPDDIPAEFFVELRVDAGNESNVDWAAWINPEVVARSLVRSAAP